MSCPVTRARAPVTRAKAAPNSSASGSSHWSGTTPRTSYAFTICDRSAATASLSGSHSGPFGPPTNYRQGANTDPGCSEVAGSGPNGARSGPSVVGRAQEAQAAAPGDLPGVSGLRPATRSRRPLLGAGGLAHGVGQCLQVVAAGLGGGRAVEEPDDFPAPGRGEALRVLGAEVVAVGFGVGGEGAEDRGRVGVDVRQRRDGGTAASGARTATYRAHDVGRYRTLDRAATTLHQVTPRCRGVKRPTRPAGPGGPSCLDALVRGPGRF